MKKIGICLLAACMLLVCASCGTRGELGDPESAAASSQPADGGLGLDDFTVQASGASPEKEAEGAESRPEDSAPSSSPEQPPVPEAASFCMIETTGSDLLSFYPLSDSEQRTFQQLLRVEEWKEPAGLMHTGGMGSPCITVGQKDGDATLYLSPGQFPPDLEVKNTLILIKYGPEQRYQATYFAPVEVLAEADAFRLRCRTLQIDARWEELQPQELPWYDAAAQTVYAQEQADLEPFLEFQAKVRNGQVSTLRLFDQPNDHGEERFSIGQENILRLLDSLQQIEAGFTEKPTGQPPMGGGCDLLVGFADGTEAYLYLRSGEDRFSFATSDGGYYSYGCANEEMLQEIIAVSYIVSYCGGIDPGAENTGIRQPAGG